MSPLLRTRSLRLLVLIGWLTQLWLPAAQAATALQHLERAGWCGRTSPAIAAQLAAMPQDIRQIVEQSLAGAERPADCHWACIGSAGTPTPAAAPAAFPLSRMPVPVAIAVRQPAVSQSSPPSTRGPPAVS